MGIQRDRFMSRLIDPFATDIDRYRPANTGVTMFLSLRAARSRGFRERRAAIFAETLAMDGKSIVFARLLPFIQLLEPLN